MTYFVGFSNNYDVWPPDEEMLRVEADDPQAAIEQVLRDGKGQTIRWAGSKSKRDAYAR